MKPHLWIIAGLALALAGCGQKENVADHDHDHAEHGDHEDEAVTFREGRGLQLSPGSIRALGISTAIAERRPFAAASSLTVQVFATQPHPLALARIEARQAEALRSAAFTGAHLVRIDPSSASATRLVDAVFELAAAPDRHVGEFVPLSVQHPSAPALTVPRSAILDSATGPFVYVVKGEAYLRTPVTVGAQSADFAAITAGLRPGDVVVSTAVDQLWLAELRLTKGGGHSH